MKLVKSETLKKGDVLALPFGKTATIQLDPQVGRRFVWLLTEHGRTRLLKGEEIMVETGPTCPACGQPQGDCEHE